MVEELLEERFKEASVLPLWLHVGPASAHKPRPTEKACMWSWSELKSLGNTTGTLNAALQVLNPDETAVPHRHSMAAI